MVLHSNQWMLNHCLKMNVFLHFILYAVNQVSLTVVVEALHYSVYTLVVPHSNQWMLNHCLKLNVFLRFILFAVNQVSLLDRLDTMLQYQAYIAQVI